MSLYFSEKQVAELHEGRSNADRQFAKLRERYFMRPYKNQGAGEHAKHGFSRRLGTLIRAIDVVFQQLPPELADIPDRDTVMDATIAIQSFVLNTFGCLDNLAWILVFEKGVRKADGSDLDPKSVSLRSKVVSKVFSDEFRTFLDSREQWFEELKHFRDALAHRIPLYIPPFIIGPDVVEEYNRLERASYDALKARKLNEYESLRAEQEKLGRFRPWMTHSRSESAPTIVFHYQLLADFNTVDEFGRAMLDELER